MTFLNVPSGPIVWLAAFAVGLPALLVAAIRRRQTSSVALVGLAVSQLVAGAAAAVAVAVAEPILGYLVVWMLPLAMFLWAATAWALWDVLGRATLDRVAAGADGWRRGPRLAAVLVVVVLIVELVPIVSTGAAWTNPSLPRQDTAKATKLVVDEAARQLPPGARLRVENVGDPFSEGGVGVIAGLVRKGFTVFTSDGASSLKWGEARVWRGQPVDATLTAAVAYANTDPDPVAVCTRAPDATKLAFFDNLSRDERRYYRLAVFQAPAPCA